MNTIRIHTLGRSIKAMPIRRYTYSSCSFLGRLDPTAVLVCSSRHSYIFIIYGTLCHRAEFYVVV